MTVYKELVVILMDVYYQFLSNLLGDELSEKGQNVFLPSHINGVFIMGKALAIRVFMLKDQPVVECDDFWFQSTIGFVGVGFLGWWLAVNFTISRLL